MSHDMIIKINMPIFHVRAMDYMHTQEVTWLQKRFRQVSSGSPSEKRVKFQTIHESLVTQFPSSKLGSRVISVIMNCVFPESRVIQGGKEQSGAQGWH